LEGRAVLEERAKASDSEAPEEKLVVEAAASQGEMA
jgi:hypothetical protein